MHRPCSSRPNDVSVFTISSRCNIIMYIWSQVVAALALVLAVPNTNTLRPVYIAPACPIPVPEAATLRAPRIAPTRIKDIHVKRDHARASMTELWTPNPLESAVISSVIPSISPQIYHWPQSFSSPCCSSGFRTITDREISADVHAIRGLHPQGLRLGKTQRTAPSSRSQKKSEGLAAIP
ncbi:hypothetical protein L226DRAFT_266192 [Lentinus tigrinus ALCF2SS1-7]|nr:hypothetical protein L226DRAFT_266192 [Lentinus tigrinus ALCF2SS1-7]